MLYHNYLKLYFYTINIFHYILKLVNKFINKII
jgi:hypothetical protein